jgi:hypothetical protein
LEDAVKKPKDKIAEAFKSIQTEADHILEILRNIQQENNKAGIKALLNIIRDDAIAIKETALKACIKKDSNLLKDDEQSDESDEC